MKILMKTTMAGPEIACHAGQIITVSPELGRQLIAAGYATLAKSAELAEPVVPPVEEKAVAMEDVEVAVVEPPATGRRRPGRPRKHK